MTPVRVLLVENDGMRSFDIVRILYEKLQPIMTDESTIELMLASYSQMKEQFISADIVLIGYPNRELIPKLSYLYGKTTYVDLLDIRAYSVIDAEAVRKQIMKAVKFNEEELAEHHQLKWSLLCSLDRKKKCS